LRKVWPREGEGTEGGGLKTFKGNEFERSEGKKRTQHLYLFDRKRKNDERRGGGGALVQRTGKDWGYLRIIKKIAQGVSGVASEKDHENQFYYIEISREGKKISTGPTLPLHARRVL